LWAASGAKWAPGIAGKPAPTKTSSSSPDRGREEFPLSPPSEPCVRFSRTRLSSQWFPHRDWLANNQAPVSCEKLQCSEICIWPTSDHLLTLTPLPSAANMRSIRFVRSTQYHSGEAVSACLALAGTLSASVMRSLFPSFQHPLSCLPSLGATLLSALFRLPLRSLGSRVRPPARRRFPGCLALFRSSALRYYEGSDSCSPSPRVTGLPACLTHTSRRSASNHVGDPDIALHANVSVSDAFQASPSPSRLAVTPRRIEFVSCGPPVRFRLLSTPPHDDAVTFSYGVLAYSDTDLHRAVCAPSRAH